MDSLAIDFNDVDQTTAGSTHEEVCRTYGRVLTRLNYQIETDLTFPNESGFTITTSRPVGRQISGQVVVHNLAAISVPGRVSYRNRMFATTNRSHDYLVSFLGIRLSMNPAK